MTRRPRFTRLFRVSVIALALTLALGTSAFAEQAGYLIINKWFEGTWNTFIRSYNTDGNQYLSEEEIAAIEEVDVSGMGLDSMGGLMLLTSLRSLDCSDNELTHLVFHSRENRYVVTSLSLNVRKGPTTSYLITGTLYKGDSVVVYSIQNGWACIIYNQETRYVSAEYLVQVGDADLPLRYLSCYGNSLAELDVTHLPFILDACINGTKDTSNPAYDKYESELGVLKVDKDVHIITTLTDYCVRWYDGEGGLLAEKFYWEGQEEPATDLTPGPWEDEHYYYEFTGWDEGAWVSATEKEYRPTYRSRVKPSVSGLLLLYNLKAEVYAPPGSRLIAAIYDTEGRLLNIQARELGNETPTKIYFDREEPNIGKFFKLLLTDTAWVPLCPPWVHVK